MFHVHRDSAADPWRTWYTEFDKIPQPRRAEAQKLPSMPASVEVAGAMVEGAVFMLDDRWGWFDAAE